MAGEEGEMTNLIEHVKGYIEAAHAYAETSTPGARRVLGQHWVGWGRYSRDQLRDLRAAGVGELVLNLNDASAGGKWKWDGSRDKILALASVALEEGFSVGLMPWVWCSEAFMDTAGEHIATLIADLGGHVRLIQLDWEGSAEVSAKALAKKAGGYGPAVDKAMKALCVRLPGTVALGVTPLYFRRPGGDALLEWSWRETEDDTDRVWAIDELCPQAYAIWDTKNPATMAPEYQPPRLQARCAEHYAPFRTGRRFGMGIAGWQLTRPAMTAAQAMRAQVDGVLAAGVEIFNVWGGHLMDATTGYEAERFDLTLTAYRRVCLGVGSRDQERDSALEGGAVIKWGERYHDPKLARGGAPVGYVLPKRAGVTLAKVVPPAKAILARSHAEGWPLGSVVPVELDGRRLKGVVQHHTWTPDGKGGHRDFDGPGCTVFVEA